MGSAARPARRRASRVPTCRGDDFLPRGCRPNLRFFSLPTAPGQGKWAWKASVGRRGFGHPLKCSCIAVPNPAPSLAVSIVKALKNFQAARPETREWAQTWPDPESPRRQTDPVPTETSTPPQPRPRPGPRPGQDPRGSHLVPTCRGPRRARLRVLTRFPPRHLRGNSAADLRGAQSPTLGCKPWGLQDASCARGRAGGTGMDTLLRARPRTFGFWGKERTRALNLRGLSVT